MGCHALLQGIFPTQGSNPGLPHCRWILYRLSHQGSPRILEWVAYPFSRGSLPAELPVPSRLDHSLGTIPTPGQGSESVCPVQSPLCGTEYSSLGPSLIGDSSWSFMWFPSDRNGNISNTRIPTIIIMCIYTILWGFPNGAPMAQQVKNLPAMQETWVGSLVWEDPLEEGMATHSSILTRKFPWTEGL